MKTNEAAGRESLLHRCIRMGFPVEKLRSGAPARLADLIRASDTILLEAAEPWDYKSLATLGTERFCASEAWWIREKEWEHFARREFAESIARFAAFEDEGLSLFVKQGGKYRPARKGDQSYDFARRLLAEHMLFNQEFDTAPPWTEDLFISRSNLEAYALVSQDHTSLSDPDRREHLRIIRDAVLRETERRESGNAEINRDKASSNDSATNPREATTLNIIGALIGLMLGASPSNRPNSVYNNQTAIIDALVASYPNTRGISKRNLETYFAKAKHHLTAK